MKGEGNRYVPPHEGESNRYVPPHEGERNVCIPPPSRGRLGGGGGWGFVGYVFSIIDPLVIFDVKEKTDV